jgi:hypothetical protein
MSEDAPVNTGAVSRAGSVGGQGDGTEDADQTAPAGGPGPGPPFRPGGGSPATGPCSPAPPASR